jgi:hypothetical protein
MIGLTVQRVKDPQEEATEGEGQGDHKQKQYQGRRRLELKLDDPNRVQY